MNYKTTGLLALVLAIGIVAVVLLDKQDDKKAKVEKAQGRLIAVEKQDISELVIEPAGIHCIKDSNDWKITQPVATDGDKSSIDAIANMFSWMKIERTISSDPSEYDVYGLNPERGKIIVAHNDQADTVYLGDKSPTGSFVFARKSGSPDVFLTSTTLKSNIEKTLFDLREKKALSFEKVNVRSFTLKCRNGEFSVVKSGGDWKVTNKGEFDADKAEIDKILNRLNSEKAKEFVDENPSNLSRYGLSRPIARIDLMLGQNSARKSLLIGRESGASYYAKDDSKKPVFLVDSSFVSLLNPDLYTLRKKDLADFKNSEINKFELEFSGQNIVCNKDTSGTWMINQPEPRKAKSWEIASITRKASQLEVVKFVDDNPSSLAKYGLAKPQAHARFYKDDALLLDVMLGKHVGDNVYAKLADKPSVYLVEQQVLETLTPKLDDLSEKPEPAENSAITPPSADN